MIVEAVLDQESRQDLSDAFADLYVEVEDCMAELNDGLTDGEHSTKTLNALFRAMHTIKGNAGMFRLMRIVEFAHTMEDVTQSLRNGELSVSRKIMEALQLGMDRLRDIHDRELWDTRYENLQEEELKELFQALGGASDADADEKAVAILRLVGAEPELVDVERSEPTPNSMFGSDSDKYADLVYYQQLSFQLENQHDSWEGRTLQIFDWAQKLNSVGGDVVDYEQLAAATYLHDIGMAFVPHRIIDKSDKLSKDEVELVQLHATVGYEYLNRVAGWGEAARIILEHHEWVDGTGYPRGVCGDQIHAGAKILAIVDAFFSIVNGRADREHRRSIVRAISEINSRVDVQFDNYWVGCFNEMIKQENRAGNI